MFDTRLSGRCCGRHLSLGLPIIPRISLIPLSPLWLISKLLLRLCLYPKTEHPWKMAELCKMFQAILSRNIPLNLSVFITRTLQTVLIRCSPAGWQQHGPARVNNVTFFSQLFLPWQWESSISAFSKGKPASESSSFISSQGGQ